MCDFFVKYCINKPPKREKKKKKERKETVSEKINRILRGMPEIILTGTIKYLKTFAEILVYAYIVFQSLFMY